MSEPQYIYLRRLAITWLAMATTCQEQVERACAFMYPEGEQHQHDLDQAIHDLKVAINRVSELLEE